MKSNGTGYLEILALNDKPDYQLVCRFQAVLNTKTVIIPIDDNIYKQLANRLAFAHGTRYLLSLIPRWNPVKECYVLKVTQFQGQQKRTFYVSCHKDFDYHSLYQIRNHKEHCYCLRSSHGKQPLYTKIYALFLLLLFAATRKVPRITAAIIIFLVLARAGYALNTVNPESLTEETEFDRIPAASEKSIRFSSYEDIIAATAVSRQRPTFHAKEVKVEKTVEYRVPEGYAALTFDDGPSIYTHSIVDILSNHQVGATFFFLGKQIEKYPETVVYAANQQMSIQNHSWSHADFRTLSPLQQIQEIDNTNALLEELVNHPVTLLRPPYGVHTEKMRNELEKRDMKVLLWNRDPEDWRFKDTDSIIEYFRETEPSGSIYLLHETKQTVEALPGIIQYLKEKGVIFTVLR